MEQHAAALEGIAQLSVCEALNLIRRGGGLGTAKQRVVVVRIPGFKKLVRHEKLRKVGVEAVLGQPVDQLQHVFIADGTLDTKAPVPVGRRLAHANAGFAVVAHKRALRAWLDKPEPKLMKKTVRRDQHAAGIASGHDALRALNINQNRVVKLGIVNL